MAKDSAIKQQDMQQPVQLDTNEGLQPKEHFLKGQNECYLCGYSLDTYVEHIPLSRFAIEKAKCHNCMTLVRVKNHSIQ